MCGPIESIKARSTNYLIIVPGGKKKSDIAKIISKKLDANIDSIDRVLPPGGMQITDSVGIDL